MAKSGTLHRILEDDYRKEYFSHNKPVKTEIEYINGERREVPYYRCIYCGKLVPRYSEDSTKVCQVDHIIPKTRFLAGLTWNPNKSWNLGASCPHCNISKSNTVDMRVIKGFRNKLLNKWGLGRYITGSGDSGYTNEDSVKVKVAMFFVMLLVCALSIVLPIGLFAIQGVLFVASAFWWIFKLAAKVILKITRFVLKRFAKLAMKPATLILHIATDILLLVLTGAFIYAYFKTGKDLQNAFQLFLQLVSFGLIKAKELYVLACAK